MECLINDYHRVYLIAIASSASIFHLLRTADSSSCFLLIFPMIVHAPKSAKYPKIAWWLRNIYPLINVYIAIDHGSFTVDLPSKNGDSQVRCVSLPGFLKWGVPLIIHGPFIDGFSTKQIEHTHGFNMDYQCWICPNNGWFIYFRATSRSYLLHRPVRSCQTWHLPPTAESRHSTSPLLPAWRPGRGQALGPLGPLWPPGPGDQNMRPFGKLRCAMEHHHVLQFSYS